MKIENVYMTLDLDKEFFDQFITFVPEGFHNAMATHKICHALNNECEYLIDRGILIQDHNILSRISWIALFNYGYPVVSCSKGRYKIKTQFDKDRAIEFMKVNHKHLDERKQPTKKYQALMKIQVKEEKPYLKGSISLKERIEAYRNKQSTYMNNQDAINYLKSLGIKLNLSQWNNFRYSESIPFIKIGGIVYTKKCDIDEKINY